MKKSKILVLFLTIVILLTAVVPFSASALEYPDITAKAAILVELNSGKVLYAKNEDEQLPLASVTKVMTVYLAALACQEQKIEDEWVIAGEDIYDDLGDDSSTQFIRPGEKMRLIDLMYCALVSSANEACNIIAEYLCGTTDAFVDEMNAKAQELGCTNTHFANPHGLTAEDHYSSARDISIILQNASKVPLFSRIAQTEKYSVPKTNYNEPRELINTNRLIQTDSDFYSEYCTGGKTGFTTAAGYCLAATAESSGKSLVCVVLGAEEVIDENGESTVMSFPEVKELIDWGVNNFIWKSAVTSGDVVATLPVAYGKGKDTVKLSSDSTVTFFVPIDTELSDFRFETKLETDEGETGLTAPVNAGDILGFTNVYYGDELGGTVHLLASESVKLDKKAYTKAMVSNFFKTKVVRTILYSLIAFIVLYLVLVVLNTIKRYKRKKRAEERKRRLAERNQDRGSLEVSSIRSDKLTKEELRHIIEVYGGLEPSENTVIDSADPEKTHVEEHVEETLSESDEIASDDIAEPSEIPAEELHEDHHVSGKEVLSSLTSKSKNAASKCSQAVKEKAPVFFAAAKNIAKNCSVKIKRFFKWLVPIIVPALKKALIAVLRFIYKACRIVKIYAVRIKKLISEKITPKDICISEDEILSPDEIKKLSGEGSHSEEDK